MMVTMTQTTKPAMMMMTMSFLYISRRWWGRMRTTTMILSAVVLHRSPFVVCFSVIAVSLLCHQSHLNPVGSRILLEFGQWSEWSPCNGSLCGGLGTQRRTRKCLEDSCPDEVQETVCRYEGRECTAVAEWTGWSDWSECSTFCEDGFRERKRTCRMTFKSLTLKEEEEEEEEEKKVEGEEEEKKRRRRQDGSIGCQGEERETIPCIVRHNCKVDGQWSEWSKWDICDSAPCSREAGRQARHRRCTNPRPMFGGETCRGSPTGTRPCYNNEFCLGPVDGEWCNWTSWSRCELQAEKRSRRCACPAPVNDGRECEGEVKKPIKMNVMREKLQKSSVQLLTTQGDREEKQSCT